MARLDRLITAKAWHNMVPAIGTPISYAFSR